MLSAEHERTTLLTLCAEQFLNRVQRFDEALLIRRGQLAEHHTNFLLRLGIEWRESGLPSPGKKEKTSPPVLLRGSLPNQSALFEGAQGAAQIPGVQPQLLGQLARRGFVAVCELIENADLSQGIRAAQ